MIERIGPRKIILIGFVLVLIGMVLPFLMTFQVIKASFFLSFFSFGASVAGLFLGMIGAAYYVRDLTGKGR